MAKYTSDINLIRGAAAVGKSMMPADLSGLDKVIAGGKKMMATAVLKQEEKKLKKEKIEAAWDETAQKVLLNAGALGDKLYDYTYSEAEQWREMYLEGVEEKDDRKKMAAMRALNNHSTWIQDHKNLNLENSKLQNEGDVSDGLSDDNKHIVTTIAGQTYESVSRGEDNDMIFHVKMEDGSIRDVTSKEYEDMMMLKNYEVSNAVRDLKQGSYASETFDRDDIYGQLLQKIPKTKKDFAAAAADDIMGQKFRDMLGEDNTREELVNTIYDGGVIGEITDEEWDNFLDVITDPDHDDFDLETSRNIMAEKLTNAIETAHGKHWKEKNEKKEGKVTDTKYQFGSNHYTETQVGGKVTEIKNARDGAEILMNSGRGIYTKDGGVWTENIYTEEGTKTRAVSENEVIQNQGYGLFGATGDTTVAEVVSEEVVEETPELNYAYNPDRIGKEPKYHLQASIFGKKQEGGAQVLNDEYFKYKNLFMFNATGKGFGRDKVNIVAQADNPNYGPGDVIGTLEFDYSNPKKQAKELAKLNKLLAKYLKPTELANVEE